MQEPIHRVLSLTMALFGGAALLAAPPAENSYVASLRRLTEQEYRNSIADIFGKEIEVRGTFEPTKRTGGLEAASSPPVRLVGSNEPRTSISLPKTSAMELRYSCSVSRRRLAT